MLSKTECDASLYGLVCSENETILKEKEESVTVDEKYTADYEEECLQMLFDREMRFGCNQSEALVLSNHLKYARLEAITWILKSEKSWAIHLPSVACLSLAAKMEEIQIPALSEFQIEGYNFASKTIQRMELLVLDTWEWRMSLITPFAFLHFFIKELCKASPPHHFISCIIRIIFFTTKEIIVMEHRPSVVAADAILRALNQRLTRKELERRMNSVSFRGFLETEDVYTCYNLMQKLEMGILNMPKTEKLPDSLPTRATDALDDSSSSAHVEDVLKSVEHQIGMFSHCSSGVDRVIKRLLGRKLVSLGWVAATYETIPSHFFLANLST
ncbi:hypothetical protein V6N12_040647 [Hibiscus sabdariffa]|uniref:Cyclin C-terminal domain-containing protein n=1 Tax=Hibiscus sabdariffa TaxID=183260 RepID=A0ABR2E4D4_9ROSI